jgi:CHAT domain-containing protein
MRLAAVTLALLATWACIGRSERDLTRIQDEALVDLRRGNLGEAQARAEFGIGLTRSRPTSEPAWAFRLLRAESLILQLRSTEALADLTDDVPQGAAFDSLRARQKYLQARANVVRGRLSEALDVIEEGRRMPSSRDVRLDLDVLDGQIRLRLGQRGDAEVLLRSVIANARAIGDQYHVACALNDLGMGRLVNKRYDDALSWFEQVLSLTDLEAFKIYAAALTNAGACYAQLGEFAHAEELQSRAIDAFERHGQTGDFGQALGELGTTYMLAGDSLQALPYLGRAFEVSSHLNLNANAALWAGNLAEAHIALGHWDDATRFNDEATRIRKAHVTGKLMWSTLAAAEIAEGRGRRHQAREFYENAVATSRDEPVIQWYANARLAHLAIADSDDRQAAEYFERTLRIIERIQSDLLKTDYKFSYLNSLMRFYDEYVDALIAQGRIDRALEIADSSRGRVLAERQRTASPALVTAASFRRVAERSGKVILFYWLQPKASWLWVVAGKEIHLVPLPAGDQIEALVREHQKMIGSVLADPLAAVATPGDKLYTVLIAPAAQWIPSGASLLIVPDGVLHGLNFETLPVNGLETINGRARRHYWIEDVEIQIVPSLGLLADAGSHIVRKTARAAAPPRIAAGPPEESLLLIGSPAVSDARFPALSYASSEMAKVAGHFGSAAVVLYEGPSASPMAYRNAAPDRFKMIHFTAHAAANVESPLDSAVILAAQDGAYKLYARDIAELPLHAELVTVSACRSAGERTYSGEGLIGFAWAFLRAGAKRVIAGLWDVDDQSTAGLMDNLYARIAAGAPPSRALRAAKLTMMRQGGTLAKPYYWGPFELFTVAP